MAVPLRANARINQFLQKAFGINPQELSTYTYDPSSSRATLSLFGRCFQFIHPSENVAKEGVHRAALCRDILSTVVEAMQRRGGGVVRARLKDVEGLVGLYNDMETLGEMPEPRSTDVGSQGSSGAVSPVKLDHGGSQKEGAAPSQTLPHTRPISFNDLPQNVTSLISASLNDMQSTDTSSLTSLLQSSQDSGIAGMDTSFSSTSTPTPSNTFAPETALSAVSIPSMTRSATPASSTSTSMDTSISKAASRPYPWSNTSIAALEEQHKKLSQSTSYVSRTPEADLAVWQRLAASPAPPTAYERLETFLSTHFGQCRNPKVYMPFINYQHQGQIVSLQLLTSDSFIYTQRIDPASPHYGNDAYHKEELALQALKQNCLRDSLKRKMPKSQYARLVDQVIQKYSDISSLAAPTSTSAASIPRAKGRGPVQIAGNAERMKARAASSGESISITAATPSQTPFKSDFSSTRTITPLVSSLDSVAANMAPTSSDLTIPTGPAAMTRANIRSPTPVPPPSATTTATLPLSARLPPPPGDTITHIPTGPRASFSESATMSHTSSHGAGVAEAMKAKPAGLPDRPKSMRVSSTPNEGMHKVYIDGKIVLMSKNDGVVVNGMSNGDSEGRRSGISPPTAPRQSLHNREEELRQQVRESSRLSEPETRNISVSIRGSADLRGRGRSEGPGSEDPCKRRYDEREGGRSRSRSRSPKRISEGRRRRSRSRSRRANSDEERDKQRMRHFRPRSRSRSRSRDRNRERQRERRRSHSARYEEDASARGSKRSRSEEAIEDDNNEERSRRMDRRGSGSSSDERRREKKRRHAEREETKAAAEISSDASIPILQLIVELARGNLDYSHAVLAASALKLPAGLEKSALQTLQAVYEASPGHMLKKANIDEGTDVVMLPRSWVEETRQLLLPA